MSNDAEQEAPETSEDPADAADDQAADADQTESAETEAAESEDGDDQPESGLQDGAFVKLSYTARTVEDGDLVDTTDQEVADEEGVGDEQEFSPRTIVLGEGHIFGPVEDDIRGSEVGDTGESVVSAEEAFGTYDEDEVQTVSKDKIPEDDRYPGAQVQIEGQQGFLETIVGGRARVDFNHPLAGEDVEYEWEVLEEIEDREEQAEGLIDMMLDLELNVWFQTDTVEEEQLVEPDEDEADAEESEADGDAAEEDDEAESPEPETELVEVEKETLYIEATPQLTMNQQWMMGKQQLAQQITQLLDVDRIIVQEELGGGGMGMMGGMGGMMGGAPGGGGGAEIEEALEEADVDLDIEE